MSDGVNQSGNFVDGPLAGRDVNTHHHYHASARPSVFANLVERYRVQVAEDERFRDFIEELTVYFPDQTSERADLADKLRKAGRESEIEEAMKLKEMFWKKLMRNQLRRAAQEIYALMLGLIDHNYRMSIRPMFAAGASREEIDAAIEEKVIRPVWLEIEENPLTIMPQDLRGMLYYLTGGCHISWGRA